MAKLTASLNIKETHIDPVYGRVFEGWISGEGSRAFGSLASTHCAMTSSQAIAYKVAAEKRAFEYSSLPKIDGSGNPVESSVELEIVFDLLPE